MLKLITGIGGIAFLFIGTFNPNLTMNQALSMFAISGLYFIAAAICNFSKGG